MHQRLYSQRTPHILPSQASYGVSFVRILVKIDRVIEAPHCKWEFELTYVTLLGIYWEDCGGIRQCYNGTALYLVTMILWPNFVLPLSLTGNRSPIYQHLPGHGWMITFIVSSRCNNSPMLNFKPLLKLVHRGVTGHQSYRSYPATSIGGRHPTTMVVFCSSTYYLCSLLW